MYLTPQQRDHYKEQGFIPLESGSGNSPSFWHTHSKVDARALYETPSRGSETWRQRRHN